MSPTIRVNIRLPADVVKTVDRRVEKSVRYKTRAGYIRDLITTEVRRDHHKRKKGGKNG